MGEDGNPLFNGDAASFIEYLQTEVLPLPLPSAFGDGDAPCIDDPAAFGDVVFIGDAAAAFGDSAVIGDAAARHSDAALLAAATFLGEVHMIFFLGEVFLGEAFWCEASLAGYGSNSFSKSQQSSCR